MFKRKPRLDLHEIHVYIDDLQRIALLRDKATDKSEMNRYNNILEVMQLTLEKIVR